MRLEGDLRVLAMAWDSLGTVSVVGRLGTTMHGFLIDQVQDLILFSAIYYD